MLPIQKIFDKLFKIFFYSFVCSNVGISFRPLCFVLLVKIFVEFYNSLMMRPMLVIATASEGYMPVRSINNSIKAVVESEALPIEVKDTNNNANGTDINKITAAEGLKGGVYV